MSGETAGPSDRVETADAGDIPPQTGTITTRARTNGPAPFADQFPC
jgi:hypothetical protein